MKIAMVSEHASPLAALGGADAGGQNVHVAELSRALARRGAELVVYTRRDARSLPARIEIAPRVVVEHVTAGPPEVLPKDALRPHMPAFATVLERAWRAWRPDLVHAHFWMSGLASLGAARRVGVPVVQTFHALGCVKRRFQGEQDTSPPDRIGEERRLVSTVDGIIATSCDEVRELRGLGVMPARVRVVPCGVDLAHFRPDGPAEPRRQRHRVVAVGRLVRRKGFDDAIAALALVPDTELVVAGGPGADALANDPEARRLMALATAAGVGNRVELRGSVARDAMPALLRSADVIVNVPWYEPFGMVPVEAMACGVPVVASAVGGILDTVVDGSTGIHVPPRRPDRIPAALRRVLGDRGLRTRLGAAGATRAHGKFGWDAIAAATQAAYAVFLDARSATAPGRAVAAEAGASARTRSRATGRRASNATGG